jgi:cytochrome c553
MGMGSLAGIAGAVAIVAALGAAPCAAEDVAALAEACAGCHGQNGTPTDATIPVIWGQQSSYLYKQLHNYKSSDRGNPVMSAVVKDISLQDLRTLANYFAAKSWSSARPASAATDPEGIVMCRACHMPNFEGGPPAPRLAGLSYEYLIAAMRNFANGERTNNLDMPAFMAALGERQRDAIARFLAGL